MLLLTAVPPLLLLLVLHLGVLPPPATALHAPELSVTLPNGSPLRGKYLTSHSGRGIRAFTNIPYAEPPVGKLRLADPVPKAPWTCPNALPPADQVIVCPQREIFFQGDQYQGQEDCLYLNVYVPMLAPAKANDPRPRQLPVMFFIHGGGFASGNGGQTLYGPEFLLEEDVILVAGNYRLGALGFLSTFSQELAGNFGLKDQALMLRWVQENIAAFGGDPQRVTIFGESAGAGSVGYHLLSPASKGLFHGAIMQSGNPYENWANISQAQNLAFAEKFLTVMDCPLGEGALECLRGKETREFVDKMEHLMVWGHHPVVVFGPVKEKNSLKPFITEVDFNQPQIGQGIPVMIGATTNDGAFMVSMIEAVPEGVPEFVKNFDELIPHVATFNHRFEKEVLKEKVALIRKHYFNDQPINWTTMRKQLADLFTDMFFMNGITKFMERRMIGSDPTYFYKFNYRGSTSFTDIHLKDSSVDINMGVSHVDDLMYLFPIVKNVVKHRMMSWEDHKMRKQMVQMWTSFARTGVPATKKVNWTPATKFPIDFMRIGNCNLDMCPATTKLMSAMEVGFFEQSLQWLDNEFNKEPVPVAKTEL